MYLPNYKYVLPKLAYNMVLGITFFNHNFQNVIKWLIQTAIKWVYMHGKLCQTEIPSLSIKDRQRWFRVHVHLVLHVL